MKLNVTTFYSALFLCATSSAMTTLICARAQFTVHNENNNNTFRISFSLFVRISCSWYSCFPNTFWIADFRVWWLHSCFKTTGWMWLTHASFKVKIKAAYAVSDLPVLRIFMNIRRLTLIRQFGGWRGSEEDDISAPAIMTCWTSDWEPVNAPVH